MDLLVNATSGGLAGAFAMFCLCPLMVANTRVQAQRKREKSVFEESQAKKEKENRCIQMETYSSAFDCIGKILKKEGTKGLFAGVFSLIPNAFATNFIFYFFFAAVTPMFKNSKNKILSNMLVGILAGIGVQLIMTPVDMISTILMSGRSKTKTFWGTLRRLIEEEGVLSLYKGIVPSILLTVNPGITNMVRLLLSRSDGTAETIGENFLAGAVAKVQIFTEQKCQDDGKETTKNSTIFGILSRIIREEGILGPYKGSETTLLASILREAVLNMTRHPIKRLLLQVFGRDSKRKGFKR